MDNPKFEIQESRYEFPYHYLAVMDEKTPCITRRLDWGFEYLSYIHAVLNEIKQLEFNNIIDVGCGDGYLLNHLNNDAEKFGIDLSEKAIMFAKAFSTDAKFEVKDLATIEQKYDLVTLIEVLEHIPDDFVENFITKVLSLIQKGGYFIVTVPTTVLPLNTKHYRHYDEKLLSQHIDKFGKVELIKEKRIYKMTPTLKLLLRLLNNKFWSINAKSVLRLFWQWHYRKNFYATQNDGHHILRVYQKC